MANNINWGQIYETTWWGDKKDTADSLYDYATPDFNLSFDFEKRIIEDDGVFENDYCLNNQILSLELI